MLKLGVSPEVNDCVRVPSCEGETLALIDCEANWDPVSERVGEELAVLAIEPLCDAVPGVTACEGVLCWEGVTL